MRKRITFREVNLLENVSKKRYVAAVIIGLLFSFVFYAFLFTLRETFRIFFSFTVHPDYLLILTTQEISFYNFIFAVFSSILGLAITLKTIFEEPKQFGVRDHYYYRKSMLFYSISFINISVLAAIIRITTIIIFIFGATISSYLSYYDEFQYLIYLILIVLFLEQWKIIRLIFKNKALKWMGISLVSILLYSFAISNIKIVDYEKINNHILSTQTTYNYKLSLPEVSNFRQIRSHHLAPKFFIVYPKNNVNHNRFPTIIFKKVAYKFEDFSTLLTSIMNNFYDDEIPLVTIQLNIDKDIKIKYINQIKNTIAKSGFSKIAYSITSENTELPKELQFDLVLAEKLPRKYDKDDIPPIPKFEISAFSKEHLYIIKMTANGKIFINGKLGVLNKASLKEFILQSPDKNIFVIDLADTNTLNDYLTIKDLLLTAYLDVRNNYCIKGYGVTLDKLYYDQIRTVKRKIPQLIVVLQENN